MSAAASRLSTQRRSNSSRVSRERAAATTSAALRTMATKVGRRYELPLAT
jgi:hypothetical protein